MNTTSEVPADLLTAENHRQRLALICDQLMAVSADLGANREALEQIRARISSDAFRVMVVGDFRRGKSTLINALLGDKVLPSFATPTTAVVTEVRYGEMASVKLWPANGDDPENVPVDQLATRIRINLDDPDDENPYRLAEVEWPIELCRNGVVIIDSPGLNEHPTRQCVTLDYLRHADAIVVVQEAMTAMSIDERLFIEASLEAYDLIFAFNKINEIDESEQDEVRRNARRRVAQVRGERTPGDKIMFVNARGALVARQHGDVQGWNDSGMADFERNLSEYLLTQRHKAKILVPARDLKKVIRECGRLIPDQLGLLDGNAAALATRYAAAQDPLADLEKRASQLEQRLQNRIHEIGNVVRSLAYDQILRLADQIPGFADSAVSDTSLSLKPWKLKGTAEAVGTEIAQKTNHAAHLAFNEWAVSVLAKELERQLQSLNDDFAEDISKYRDAVEKVRQTISGREKEGEDSRSAPFDLLSEFASDFALSSEGFDTGVGVAHILKQIMASLGVALVWLFTPFGWGVLAVGVVVQVVALQGRASGKIESKIKSAVGDHLAKVVRERASKDAESVVDAVDAQLSPIVTAIADNLRREVEEVRRQVEMALRTKRSGEERLAERRRELSRTEKQLRTVNEELDELIGDVAFL